MSKRYVLCSNGHRNDRTGGRRKCVECRVELPKARVTKHKRQLRDVPYVEWERISNEIHGAVVEYGACGVCGRMPVGNRHDRDHDHDNGEIRGLACTGDFGCNRMMPRKLSAELARKLAHLMVAAPLTIRVVAPWLPRDLTPERAEQIADYLERVADFYARRAAVSA